jgi:hypothetical protein
MTTTADKEYEAAIIRFLTCEIDAPAFVAILAQLEMDRRTAERAAYAAEAEHYGVDQ